MGAGGGDVTPCSTCGSIDLELGLAWSEGRGCRCRTCKKAFTQPKPDADKARRPAGHRKLVKKFGRGFCELCLRREAELPASQDLDGHHVVEFADGGTDDQANVWILCTSCHRLVHHQRTYLGHYHARSEEDAA